MISSPILPRSDPFAIPRAGLHDALAPVARFLMLFALFTAAGTAILMVNRRAQPRSEPVEPAATTAQQLLAPEANEIQPPPAPPTASGPLDATTPRTGRRTEGGSQSAVRNPKTEFISSIPLPRVQTSDLRSAAVGNDPARGGVLTRPPAVARLSRYILEVPSRQAQHDENQSSLH